VGGLVTLCLWKEWVGNSTTVLWHNGVQELSPPGGAGVGKEGSQRDLGVSQCKFAYDIVLSGNTKCGD